MWLGEKITDGGVGNGISLLIMIGIIIVLPVSLSRMNLYSGFRNTIRRTSNIFIRNGYFSYCNRFMYFISTRYKKNSCSICKRVVGNKQYGGVRQFIPLKVNASWCDANNLCSAIMFIPVTLAGFSDDLTRIFCLLFQISQDFGIISCSLFCVVVFTYFYTAITVNPKQMAEDMKRNGGFIPGIKPGRKTAEYLDNIMSRITLPGSLYLGIIAILPGIVLNLKPDMTPGVCTIFWRYIFVNYGWSCIRYTSTN